MSDPAIAAFGSWKSPITSDMIVAGTIGLDAIQLTGQSTFWLESRPAEEGRSVIVRQTESPDILDLIPAPFNARTRVHEYGGGAYLATDEFIYFSHFADQRLYRVDLSRPNDLPVAITPANKYRYANACLDSSRNRLICVVEDHTNETQEATNAIAAIDLASGALSILASGYDFYSSPTVSPDGGQLAWFCWNHPNMPWDESALWLADIAASGSLENSRQIAGDRDESISHPIWSPDGKLYFLSDRSGWWNIYRWADGNIEAILPDEAEYGTPHWVFGETRFGFRSASELICIRASGGIHSLIRLTLGTGSAANVASTIDIPYTTLGNLKVKDGSAWFIGSSATLPAGVVKLDLVSGTTRIIRQSTNISLEPGYLSIPRTVEFPTANQLTAHGFYYPPCNSDFAAGKGERPPLLVFIHGGPTAATTSAFNLSIQFWTSRGFAILDLNYGGSTGFGRAYRNRLYGNWGVVDLQDCVHGARYLVEQGLADESKLAIRGGSAGGYTTLSALTFSDVFKAGASYFGVSDLEALARDTHKFESRYLDRVVGPYPGAIDLYKSRSPINYTDQLACPVIFFQGLDDKVVPPNQAEIMVNVLKNKGLPVAYVPFAGEGHGFRKAENIKRALDAELYFYSRVFQFEPSDYIEPVPIANLDG